jgi:hypothetical protein
MSKDKQRPLGIRQDRDFEANLCSKCDCRAKVKQSRVVPRYFFALRPPGSRSIPPTISDLINPAGLSKASRSGVNEMFARIC